MQALRLCRSRVISTSTRLRHNLFPRKHLASARVNLREQHHLSGFRRQHKPNNLPVRLSQPFRYSSGVNENREQAAPQVSVRLSKPRSRLGRERSRYDLDPPTRATHHGQTDNRPDGPMDKKGLAGATIWLFMERDRGPVRTQRASREEEIRVWLGENTATNCLSAKGRRVEGVWVRPGYLRCWGPGARLSLFAMDLKGPMPEVAPASCSPSVFEWGISELRTCPAQDGRLGISLVSSFGGVPYASI